MMDQKLTDPTDPDPDPQHCRLGCAGHELEKPCSYLSLGRPMCCLPCWWRAGPWARPLGPAAGCSTAAPTGSSPEQIKIFQDAFGETPDFSRSVKHPETDMSRPWIEPWPLYHPRLFWAQTALASLAAISGPKKVSIFRAHPSNAPRNDVARLKTIM
jgi:hypothetical protein